MHMLVELIFLKCQYFTGGTFVYQKMGLKGYRVLERRHYRYSDSVERLQWVGNIYSMRTPYRG